MGVGSSFFYDRHDYSLDQVGVIDWTDDALMFYVLTVTGTHQVELVYLIMLYPPENKPLFQR